MIGQQGYGGDMSHQFVIRSFLEKPWTEKVYSIRHRFILAWGGLLPSLPLPVRLPYGGWWLARNDECSAAVFTGNFEPSEYRFVERFVKQSMTVLDIGAHNGFYTLLAAKKVGPAGKVIAFEPSPRERARLRIHGGGIHRKNDFVRACRRTFKSIEDDGKPKLDARI